MAITFRGTKGAPLTHDELDQNFREFYFSSSYIGESGRPYGVEFFRSKSLDSGEAVYFPQAIGNNYWIQIKSGSSNISSSHLTGSSNFQYDYDNDHLSVSGSGQFSGNVVILGTLTAQEYHTEVVSASVIFESGSTIFGDSADDTHRFTGSVKVTNGITGSLLSTNGVLSGSAQIASQISGSSTQSITSLSSSVASDIATNKANIATNAAASASFSSRITSNDLEIASLTAATSSYLLNTTDTLTGNLTVTGILTAQQFNTEFISSSIIYESGSTKFGDSADDQHSFTGSVDILGPLGITGFPDVSASLALAISASGTSNVNITNNSNNRILTATGTDTINGETNLTFNGSTLTITGNIDTGQGATEVYLMNQNVRTTDSPTFGALTVTGDGTINGTKFTKFTSSDTDITGLIGGSTSGTLIEGIANGHIVLGIQEDSLTDSFAIIGGAGDYYSNTNYDKLIFKVSGSGQTYIGGALSVDGALDVDGAITATGDITAFYSSDERLKDNIIPLSNAITKIKQIGGYEFDWNDNSEHSGHDVGVIAQEIEKVLPEIVVNRDNGYKAVRYEKIVALLIQAVKEQQLQIDELKSKL